MIPTFRLDGEITAETAAALAEFLTANTGPVDVIINSPGGDAFSGAAMLAEVERHGRVTIRVRGLAASAASLVAVGGWEIYIAPDALLMIHDPRALVGGTPSAIRQQADALDKIGETYARAYARHTGHPVARIRAWMQEETWLTAEEAVQLHFADKIEEPAGAEPVRVPVAALAHFHNIPADILSRCGLATA